MCPLGVPVEQSPLERDIRPSAGLARNGKDALVPGRAFGGEVDHAVVVGVETAMPVGRRRRQGVQGAGREDHADRLRGAGRVELGIARHGAVAEAGWRAKDARGPWWWNSRGSKPARIAATVETTRRVFMLALLKSPADARNPRADLRDAPTTPTPEKSCSCSWRATDRRSATTD